MIRKLAVTLFMMLTIAIALATGVQCPSVAAPELHPKFVHDAYPGWNKSRTAWRNVGLVLVQRGAKAYYMVYGRWPGSWKEVRDSLIFQAPLYGPNFQVIDPDDKQLDYFLDVIYEPGAEPKVHSFLISRTFTTKLEPPLAYQSSLKVINKHIESFHPEPYLDSTNRLKQLAIISMLRAAAEDFVAHHQRAPRDIFEVLDAGMAPISKASLNPVTGQPFRFDGSPNDVRVRINGIEVQLEAVDYIGHAEPLQGIP